MDRIDEFLLHRERRVEHQNSLMKANRKSTLITIRANYPGIDKSNYITDDIVKVITDNIKNDLQKDIIYNETYKNAEGVISHFLLNMDSLEVKKTMVYIEENHILGRCVDIDVYEYKDDEVIGISRRNLNLESRKCFLCNEKAVICTRSQRHDIEEIKKYFELKYLEYVEYKNRCEKLSYKISQFSLKAMIEEVSTMPSFGLVSPETMGSHKDMNYYTFVNSAFAITPFLKEMFEEGYSFKDHKSIFKNIREIGKKCEKEMFKITNGVNTHKGMIFLMGVACSAIGKTLYENKEFSNIKSNIIIMVENILDDFKDIEKKQNLTHGEKLYLNHGFTGIRGQVKDGLAIIFDDILLKYLNSKLKDNELYAQCLLELMASIEDSTIVHRHDINTLRRMQSEAKELLELGGMNTEEGKLKAKELEKKYINDCISPGGCADLLAVTILLANVHELMS